MFPTRALVLIALLGLAVPAIAGDEPAPAPAPGGVRPPASWQPEEDGPPTPSFPPSSVPKPGAEAANAFGAADEAPVPTDPFADEEGIRPTRIDASDPPSGGQAGRAIPLPREIPTKTEVVAIGKTHNVIWRCGCPGKAIRFDILFSVVGLKGDWVGAAIDFYDPSGRPLLSVHEPFMNRSGQVSAWTRLILVKHDARWLRTTLVVPYKAFPCPPGKESYEVQARVRLLKRRGVDQYVTLVQDATTFQVFSQDDGPRDWHDYVGSDRRTPQPCTERVQRFKARGDGALKTIYAGPRRAKEMWQPFCAVPGS